MSKFLPYPLLLILGGFFAGSGTSPADDLLLCGADRVSVVSAQTGTTHWSWRAADSAQIPEAAHKLFLTTDDCKPYGPYILVTSSSDGVALILREDKRCAFYTRARNAHSACLLPGMRVAVAASYGGDALLIFDRRTSGLDVEPLQRLPLKGAHGVTWDATTETCWALGGTELLALDRNLEVILRVDLPTAGGHDLSPARKADRLFVTTNTAVYEFDTRAHTFTPHATLGQHHKVKSVDVHPRTNRIVYQQATPEAWWGHTIRFARKTGRSIELARERLYKIRWDVPEPTPEDHLAAVFEQLGGKVFRNGQNRIVEVVLNGCELAGQDLHQLAWLPYLTDLSLEQTGITGRQLTPVKDLARLEWLNLWQTRIGDDGLQQLAGLTRLQHLPIGGTNITDAGLKHLGALTGLKYLGLRKTAVTSAGMQHLAPLTHLEELNLSETAVNDDAIPSLAKLMRLKKLWIQDTSISAQGFNRLRTALPGCLVFQ